MKRSRQHVRVIAQEAIAASIRDTTEISGILKQLDREWRLQGKRLRRWLNTISRLESLKSGCRGRR